MLLVHYFIDHLTRAQNRNTEFLSQITASDAFGCSEVEVEL